MNQISNNLLLMWKSVLLVGAGGFLGSVLRYLSIRLIQVRFVTLFPWGTMFVNVLGSFLIGIILGLSEKGDFLGPQTRLLLAVGFCGGFTTFSSYSNDAFFLMQNKEWIRFLFYSTGSFFLGLLSVFAGRLLTKLF